MEQGFVNKLIGRTRMQEALDRANGRAGTPQLRRLLAGLLPQHQLQEAALQLGAGERQQPERVLALLRKRFTAARSGR